MPGAARLKAVGTMSAAYKNESAESETSRDEDKLANAEVSSAATPTVVVTPGIPALPKKLAQKILNRENVDFTELPPVKGRAKPMSLDWEGQVLLVQSMDLYAAKKLIPDLATWV